MKLFNVLKSKMETVNKERRLKKEMKDLELLKVARQYGIEAVANDKELLALEKRHKEAMKNDPMLATKEEIAPPNAVEEDMMDVEKTKEEANLEEATDNVYNIFMNFLNEEETASPPTPNPNIAINFGNVKLPKDFEKKENIYESANIPPSSSSRDSKYDEPASPKDNPTILQDKRNRPFSNILERLKCLFSRNKKQFLKLLKYLFKSFKTFISTVLITLLSSLSVCVLSIYTLARELFSALKTFCTTLNLKPNMSV